MKGHHGHRRRAHRWVLALLAVLASVVYLNRQVEPGGVMVSGAALAAPMGAMVHGGSQPSRAVQQTDPDPVAADPISTPPPGKPDGASAALLPGAAPNAPPTPAHDHGAHCPFCFTAAFAVVAAGVALPVVHPRVQPVAERAYVRPHLLALGHADARGPPGG